MRAIFGAVIVAAAAGYYAYPHWTLSRIEQAIAERDIVKLDALVDWPALRTSLKADLQGMFMRHMADPSNGVTKDNPFAALGAGLGMVMIDKMLDGVITPQFLFEKAATSNQTQKRPLKGFVGSAEFVSPTLFHISIRNPDNEAAGKLIAVMEFLNMSWRVTRVILPTDLLSKAPSESRILETLSKSKP